MAKAKATFSEPVVESVMLTLTLEETLNLTKFLGKTQIRVVEDLMPYSDKDVHIEINTTLYHVYQALNEIVQLPWNEI